MKTKNLFGEMVEVDNGKYKNLSKYQIFKQKNNYRKSDSGLKCKNCNHHHRYEYHNKYYHKCDLLGVSNSEATDIRISFVCDKWEFV